MTRFLFVSMIFAMILSNRGLNAQSYDLSWNSVDGGGAMNSTGGTFTLSGSMGQVDAQVAPVMSGGAFQLTGGFWPAASVACTLPGDVNLDSVRNGRDIQFFLNCLLGAGGSCACADTNGNGTVGFEDVAGFVSILLGL